MADVLIKGMEVPKACGDCPFFKRGANPMGEDFIFAQPWGDCLVSGEENVIEHDISKDCPLVEVPPHGGLISRQDVIQVLKDSREVGCIDRYTNGVRRAIFDEVLEVIEDKEILPTVLEATE